MNYYEERTRHVLNNLGISKPYRGGDYIASSIRYISLHENCFTPITKILYPEISKMHHTSRDSVECGIREIIELIWSDDSNAKVRKVIFPNYESTKPTNSEFLSSLYQYLYHKMHFENFTYICPTTGSYCKHSQEILTKLNMTCL